MSEHKFPSEVIDLPSEGKLYPKEHPCSNGKIEIKYIISTTEWISKINRLNRVSSSGVCVTLS